MWLGDGLVLWPPAMSRGLPVPSTQNNGFIGTGFYLRFENCNSQQRLRIVSQYPEIPLTVLYERWTKARQELPSLRTIYRFLRLLRSSAEPRRRGDFPIRENCLPVIASAWNQSRHLSVTASPDSTVKAQSSSLVRLPRTPRASSLEIMRR